MPESPLFCALLALALLALGLMGGILLSRFVLSRANDPPAAELSPRLAGLLRFTQNFLADFSEYRSLMEAAAQRARELTNSSTSASDVGAETSAKLLSQIIEANELLRRRLDDAESTLERQAAEINSYITQARTDPLTGLPNRRVFDDELARRLALQRRNGQTFGVLLIDVDRFKAVNDRYGHQVGDHVLRSAAEALREAVRESDLLARYGGEEFAVLVAGNSEEEFKQAAERIRSGVQRRPIESSAGVLGVTVSCGGAAPGSGEDSASLLRRADAALYASKAAGRNCSHWHDGQGSVRIATPPVAATGRRATESFREVCAELRKRLMQLTE